LVVTAEPTHDRKSDHLVPCILRGRNRSASLRDLLLNPLMRSCLVEVGHILIEHALELLLAGDQQMVETFLSDASQIAFTDRIGSWSMIRGFENLNPCAGYLNYPFLKAESNERDGGTFYSDELLFTTDDPGSHHNIYYSPRKFPRAACRSRRSRIAGEALPLRKSLQD